MLEQFNHLVHVDNGKLRKSLPPAKYITPAQIAKLVKNFVGMDLSKMVAPVNINEPCSILQKVGEIPLSNNMFAEAAKQEDSLLRMAYVVSGAIAGFA